MVEVDQTMRGKTCLITGATAGIGLVTARELARLGATVVVVGRNPAKTAAVVKDLQEETGNTAIEFLLADLSCQLQIHELAQQFRARHARLDVLINNAGGAWRRRQLTVDGLEMTIAVNHLAPFLLTHLLMDRLTGDSASDVRDPLSPRTRGERAGVRGDRIARGNSSNVAKDLSPLTPAPLPLSTGGEGNSGAAVNNPPPAPPSQGGENRGSPLSQGGEKRGSPPYEGGHQTASPPYEGGARGGVRIINLSSIAHYFASLDWSDLMAAKSYTGYRQYCRSKLMTLMFTYELARRHAGTNVTVNAVHPGFVRTSIARDFGWQSRFFDLSAWLFGINAAKGARTVVWLASSPEVAGLSGQYFVRQHPAKTSAASHDEDAARRLWDWSMEMTHLTVAK